MDIPKKKYELELQKEILKTKRFEIVFKLLKTCVKGGVFLGSLYITFKGLEAFIGQGENLISMVIQGLNLGNALNLTISLVLGGLWYKERKGKQRAIKEKAHFQKLAEKNDFKRSSSGLTEIGTTPTNEEEDDD